MMTKIIILGSTGSIGINTLKVLDGLGDYKPDCLTAYSNLNLLAGQANRYRPSFLGIAREKDYNLLIKKLKYKPKRVFFGQEGLKKICQLKGYGVIVIAVVGYAGLIPLIESIKRNRKILLANKESLVCAGEIVMDLLKKSKAKLIPVDSEHNAVFQCLKSQDYAKIKRIILTASGGPFCDFKSSDLRKVTPAQALAHPKWRMGRKISVDSATLMNKGFEVIEAKWLFGIDVEKIEVLIHRQAIIHSMVEFIDGSVLAQLSTADMKLPIQYALTFPQRMASSVSGLNFSKISKLTFSLPDIKKFPCLKIAYEVARKGGTYPCALNAADEELVRAYLEHRIKLTDIPDIIKKVLSRHKSKKNAVLDDIFDADISVRKLTNDIINKKRKKR
jgi:1-deoxy-D-xylulose-5-phosphate reductoisomerase